MYCENCGEKINSESNFCKFCGASISKPSQHKKSVKNNLKKDETIFSKKIKRWLHIIFSTICAFSVFLGIILFLAILDSDPNLHKPSLMDYLIFLGFLLIPFVYFFIYTNTSKDKLSSWNLYKKNAKILITSIFVFWVIGKGEKHFSESFVIILSFLSLIPVGILFLLTGKQIKKDTDSKWSYWCGSLSFFFWGLGAYYGAKEFRKEKRVHLVGKILTIIAYMLVSIILWGSFFGYL